MTETTTHPVKGPAVHDNLAINSLVFALLGFCLLPVIGSVLGIVLGVTSFHTADREQRQTSGLATWGVALGWIGLVVTGIAVIALVAAQPWNPHANCTNYAGVGWVCP